MFDVDVDVPITFVDLGVGVHLVRRIPFFFVDAFLLEWPGDVVAGQTTPRSVSLPTCDPPPRDTSDILYQAIYTEGNFVTRDTLLLVDVSRRRAPRIDS